MGYEQECEDLCGAARMTEMGLKAMMCGAEGQAEGQEEHV